MKQKILWIAIGIIAAASSLTTAIFWSETLIDTWKPWVYCGIPAIASGCVMWKLWQRLTNSSNVYLNFLCQTGMALCLFLTIFFVTNNKCGEVKYYTENVTVENKIREEHHRTRRVGRRHYSTGEKYYTYSINVKFPDGQTKELMVSLQRYNRIRSGSTIELTLREGFLGFPVIEEIGKQVLPS